MYDAGIPIEGYELLEEVPYSFDTHTSEELIEIIKAAGNEFNVPMCERLAKLFNYNMDGTVKEEPKAEEPVTETPPVQEEWKWVDERPFFEKYTPLNIVRELKKRVTGV
jgi:hypothetical protein